MKSNEEIELSGDEFSEALAASPLKIPDKTGIFRGARFLLSAKIGGVMQLVTVVCKGEPYRHEFANGKRALCVDVFGYGISKRVNVKKLRGRV